MANPLRELPPEVLKNVREYASDRVQPHSTALLIKNLIFYRDHWDVLLFVYGDLTKRMYKCSNATCWMCRFHDGSCGNARDVTRPVTYRRYLLTDFMEPDRYIEESNYASGILPRVRD